MLFFVLVFVIEIAHWIHVNLMMMMILVEVIVLVVVVIMVMVMNVLGMDYIKSVYMLPTYDSFSNGDPLQGLK